METNIYREKLLNAILYFAKNTKFLNTTKISKLLYFLDFTHCKEVGYPSIGLTYYTFEKGPVPKDFWLEVKDGEVPVDFKNKLALIRKRKEDDINPEYKEMEFRAAVNPNLSVFTPREKKIMENVAFMFKEARAWEISEVTHLPNQPWDVTKQTKGKNKPIDYILAIDSDSEVDMIEAQISLKEHFDIIKNFELRATKDVGT